MNNTQGGASITGTNNHSVNNVNPSLSQYFTNDPPSFFDQLQVTSNLTGQQQQSSQILQQSNQPHSGAPSATTTATTAAVTGKSSNTMTSNYTAVNNSTNRTTSSINNNNLFSKSFNGSYVPVEYLEKPALLEEDMKIPDDVRSIWPPAQVDHGVPPLLTMPGLSIATELVDPIVQAVARHLDPSEFANRKVLTVDGVTQDERGLRSLIAAGCYRAAVNLTGRLLSIHGQGCGRIGQPAKHSPYSLQLWFTRLALLTKLGEFEILQKESEPFDQLQKPDVFFEFYPEMYHGRTGSIACFSFRLLLAELPLHTGKPSVALDRLARLYETSKSIKEYYEQKLQQMQSSRKTRKMEEDTSENEDSFKLAISFWEKRTIRVMYATINCALAIKKYNLIDDLLSMVQTSLTKEELRALFSAWGRIYLQTGDIFGAEQKFAEARRLRDINTAQDLRDLVDKGLVAVAQNNFQEAYTIFQKALHLDNCNTMILNNMGVCLLYAGKLREAINLFERAIDLNPQRSLDESLLINLSTLYELESNNSRSKKLKLLRLINMYKPDLKMSLEVCLKLQVN